MILMIHKILKAKKALSHRFVFYSLIISAVILVVIGLASYYIPEKNDISNSMIDDPAILEIAEGFKDFDKKSFEEQQSLLLRAEVLCRVGGVLCDKTPSINKKDFENSFVYKISAAASYPLAVLPSSTQYVNTMLAQAGITPKAYAATGIGFQAISPFQEIWKQMRNIAYLLITLIMIFSAFYIMFRSGSDSNGAITIENYLPKIIVVMIFIELSYAISGFMIDLMYISIMAVYLLLQGVLSSQMSYIDFITSYIMSSPKDLYSLIIGSMGGFTGVAWASKDLFFIFGTPIGLLVFGLVEIYLVQKFLTNPRVVLKIISMITTASAAAGGTAGGGLSAAIGTLPGGAVGAVAGALAGTLGFLAAPFLLLFLFLLLMLLYFTWKVLMYIIKAYITIVFLTVFSPLIILMDLIPNSNYGIKSWIRSYVSQLSIFPVIFTVLIMLVIIGASLRGANSAGNGFQLPFMPAINSGFTVLIGLGILSLLPKIIDSVQSAISRSLLPDVGAEFKRDFDATRALYNKGRGLFSGARSRVGLIAGAINTLRP